MDEQPLIPDVPTEPKRSQLLTILCILTFAGSGMNAFSSLFIAAFYDAFQLIAQEISEKLNLPGMEILLNATPVFFLITGLLYVGSLTGAVIMWRQRKAGFHVYTIAQILLLIAPMYFLNMPGPSVIELIFSGLFIILYSTQLKQMHH
ncbi:MAG: hypothetical protein JXA23_01915 [Bacteroidales bacterium]|nr:hypothetical protein [Bacteroidales bacterium]